MTQSTTTIATSNGSRYLQQLCKHWGHRAEATFDAHQGVVDFGGGERVTLAASPDSLTITIEEPDPAKLEGFEQAVVDHIQRFGFRETLVFAWSRTPQSGT